MTTEPQDATLSHSTLPCMVSKRELWSSLKYLHRELEDLRSFPLLSKILGSEISLHHLPSSTAILTPRPSHTVKPTSQECTPKFFLNRRISNTQQCWTVPSKSLVCARHCSNCWQYSRKQDKPHSLCSNGWSGTYKANGKIISLLEVPHALHSIGPTRKSLGHGQSHLYSQTSPLLFSTHYLKGKMKSRFYSLNRWLGCPTSPITIVKLSTYLSLYFSCFSSIHFPHYHLLLLLLPPKQRTLPNFHLPLLPGKNY